MLSKAVSREQAILYGCNLLKDEELHNIVQRGWNNKKNYVAMARAFAGHHQIVCAILEHKGSNDFLTAKNGLTFGICNNYVADDELEGVVPVPMAPLLQVHHQEHTHIRSQMLTHSLLSKIHYFLYAPILCIQFDDCQQKLWPLLLYSFFIPYFEYCCIQFLIF